MLKRFIALPRSSKRLIMITADVVMLPLVLGAAFMLRVGDVVSPINSFGWIFFVAPLLSIPIFIQTGIYRCVVRYFGKKWIFSALRGVTLSSLLLLALVFFAGVQGFPRSVLLIYWSGMLFYLWGSRVVVRAYFTKYTNSLRNRERIVIYGAGSAGAQLITTLRNSGEFLVVAFVDEKTDLHGSELCGVSIYPPSRLPDLMRNGGVSQVLLAVPAASRSRRREIIRHLSNMPLRIQTVPVLTDLLCGKARVDDIREVGIEDLLEREPVPPDPKLLGACIKGKGVMITGAGGSIGVALCREVLALGPKRLVLFEQSEFNLYSIDKELRDLKRRYGATVEIIPVLGSVIDSRKLEAVLRNFHIHTIYHAAAYKHVPLVEQNPIEGVRTNVFGTWRLAEAAKVAGVEMLVMISTDKAVRPTNIMGASKRYAELVLQGLTLRGGPTRFTMVRFGNVLGSSGSVVPLFRDQIRKGGPLTITHPEITRYFMVTSEAAQLVIQAGSIGRGGDMFVLDMGEPIKIIDMARRMVHLSGLQIKDDAHPDGDILIEIVGLRPGEKLYEELLIGGKVENTEHPRIMRAIEAALSWPIIQQSLEKLDEACHRQDVEKVIEVLEKTVVEYHPSPSVKAALRPTVTIAENEEQLWVEDANACVHFAEGDMVTKGGEFPA